MSTNQYYCDSSNPTRKWEELLSNPERVLFNDGFSVTGNTDKITEGIVFVHLSFLGSSSVCAIPNVLNDHESLLVVVVSGGAQAPPYPATHERLYFRQTAVQSSTDIAFKNCVERFIEALADSVNFNLLDPDPEPTLAFRLLCEAKKKCGRDDTSSLNDLTIHAPKDITEWLAPFGEFDSDYIPARISEVTAMIGGGDNKDKAEIVLKAANGDGDLLDAVDEFLKVSIPQSKQN